MRWLLSTAVVLLAGCGQAPSEPATLREQAEPRRADLGWHESYGRGTELLRFEVASLDVRADGWSARVAIENDTPIAFELGRRPLSLRFGLMLFADGTAESLEAANRAGELPALREATTIDPSPPEVLAVGARWEATLSAPGSLPDGSYVRVSFGTLVALGEPPGEMVPTVVWITDHSYRL